MPESKQCPRSTELPRVKSWPALTARPMPIFGRRGRLLIAATLLCSLTTAFSSGRVQMTEVVLTRNSVVQFLNKFEEIAEKENFDLIKHMIHDKAFFRFNDGDFVGKEAVRAVFEKTWKGSANVKKERFYLTDIEVLTVDASSATATYTYNWEGTMDGRAFRIQGRGTRVLVVENGRLQIIHEHLSRYPKS
jgi:ketosteroid isomerase-like protein